MVIFSELVRFILVNLTFHFLAYFLKLSSSSNNTSFVSDSATPCTVADQVPLSMGVFRQEYWSGLPCPPPGDLPDPGIEHTSPLCPLAPPGKPFLKLCIMYKNDEDYHLVMDGGLISTGGRLFLCYVSLYCKCECHFSLFFHECFLVAIYGQCVW